MRAFHETLNEELDLLKTAGNHFANGAFPSSSTHKKWRVDRTNKFCVPPIRHLGEVHMKKIVLLAMAGTVVTAHAVLVDDFSTSYTNSIGTGTWVDSQSGSMLGGERDVELAVLANTFSQFADTDIPGSAASIFSNGFGVESVTTYQYDRTGDEAGNMGPGKLLKNGGTGAALIGSPDTSVLIDWLGNDLRVVVDVTTRLNGSTLGTASGVRLAGSGAGSMLINVLGLDKADSLTIAFHGDVNADFGISRIQTVPEPATLLGLTSLLAGAVLRRRNRTR